MEGITNELIINALSQDTESINNEFMAQAASSGMESMIMKALLPVIAIINSLVIPSILNLLYSSLSVKIISTSSINAFL